MRTLSLESLERRELLTVYGGVDFAQGQSSFADEVLFYRPKGTLPAHTITPTKALGVPDFNSANDSGYVSLGEGGALALRFIDNVLTNSGSNLNDLWIFEIGYVETSLVAVRPTFATAKLLYRQADADGFYFVKQIAGSTRGLDLDAVFTGHAAGTLKFDAIKITDDPTADVGLSGVPGADLDAVGSISSATVPARVSIVASDAAAAEAGLDKGQFTVNRSGSITSSLKVELTYSGTATKGTDYQSPATLVTIPAGSSSVKINIVPINDLLAEGTETVVAKVVDASGVTIDANKASATVRIADNDQSTKSKVSLTVLDPRAAESVLGTPSNGSLLLQRDAAGASLPLTVTLQLGGTAKTNIDYAIQVVGATATYNATTKRLTVKFAANARNAMILVNPKNDSLKEIDETVTFSIVASSLYSVDSTRDIGWVTIADKPA